jgi:hypothetical protein
MKIFAGLDRWYARRVVSEEEDALLSLLGQNVV